MNFVFAILAILCGACIALEIVDKPDTIRTLTGLGICLAGLAACAPSTGWPWSRP